MRRLKMVTIAMALVLMLLTVSVHGRGDTGGLTLQEAIARARTHSPILELARVQQDKAALEAEQAAEVADTIPEDDVDNYTMAMLKYLYPYQAEVASQLARKKTTATREDLELQVEVVYRSLQMARRMARVAEAGLRVAREGLQVARDMHEAGMITWAEVLAAERDVEQIRSMWVSSGVGAERAALTLSMLLVLDADDELELSAAEPRFSPPGDIDLDRQVRRALRNRYEIAEVNAMVDITRYRLDLVREYPSGLSFSWPDLPFDLPFDPPDDDAEVEDEYALPIAELEYREAILMRRLRRSEIEQQVRSLYLGIREAEQGVREAEAGLRAAQEAWRVAVLKFNAEKISRLDLLRVNLEKIQSEASHVNALYQYELALARFNHAGGKGSSAGLEGGT